MKEVLLSMQGLQFDQQTVYAVEIESVWVGVFF